MRPAFAFLLVGTAMLLASPMAHAAYRTCEAVLATASNIADPFPEGRVDNAAPAPVGTELPQSGGGYLGSDPPIIQPDNRGVYFNIQWGPEQWEEPTRMCALTYQLFDFQPAKDYNPHVNDGKRFPVIVYFHPNGEVHGWERDSLLDRTVAKKAREEHYHFISVEYRHPVADQYLQEDPLPNYIPHDDVGLFIEYLRGKADYMKVDARNIFAFGRSRGALALWHALKANKDGPQSRKISAFVGYQAQTSYQCDRYADQFLTGAGIGEWKTKCKSPSENRYDSHFKNAVDEVAPNTTLPVMLQYENFFRMDGENIRKITLQEYESMSLNEQLHYPNFGKALQQKYKNFNILQFIKEPEQDVPNDEQFRGWFNFVELWRVAP
jgi:hypothetical protein